MITICLLHMISNQTLHQSFQVYSNEILMARCQQHVHGRTVRPVFCKVSLGGLTVNHCTSISELRLRLRHAAPSTNHIHQATKDFIIQPLVQEQDVEFYARGYLHESASQKHCMPVASKTMVEQFSLPSGNQLYLFHSTAATNSTFC